MKELIILERTNGWYGGYINNSQVFNTEAIGLFDSIKYYTDEGYKVICLDKTQEENFMQGRITLEDYYRD